MVNFVFCKVLKDNKSGENGDFSGFFKGQFDALFALFNDVFTSFRAWAFFRGFLSFIVYFPKRSIFESLIIFLKTG